LVKIIYKTTLIVVLSGCLLALIYQSKLDNHKTAYSLTIAQEAKANIKAVSNQNTPNNFNIMHSNSIEHRLDEKHIVDIHLLNFRFLYGSQKYPFQHVTFENIKEQPQIAKHYGLNLDQATKKLQYISYYISDKYSVPLSVAEEIVFYAHYKSLAENIDPLLLLSIISVESTFRPQSKSHAGAIGLTQVIPRWHPKELGRLPNDGAIWSIPWNIYLGANIIKKYLNSHDNNLTHALQKYNGSLNDKTRRYSRKVLHKLSIYQSAFDWGKVNIASCTIC